MYALTNQSTIPLFFTANCEKSGIADWSVAVKYQINFIYPLYVSYISYGIMGINITYEAVIALLLLLLLLFTENKNFAAGYSYISWFSA